MTDDSLRDDDVDDYPDREDDSFDPRLFSDMPDDETTEALASLYQDGLLNAWWDEEQETTKMQMTKKGRIVAETFGNAPPEMFEMAAQGDTFDPSVVTYLGGEGDE